jgi:cobalt-zinc-cadmium efflux system outer membrane protein
VRDLIVSIQMNAVCSNTRPMFLLLGIVARVCVPVASALAQGPAAAGGSLDLRAVLDSVVATHPAIRAAQARLRAATGSRQTAGQYANPVLAFGVDNTAFPGGQSLQGTDREVMTTLTIPLEPLYQRGRRTRQADAQVRAAAADAQGMAQTVALDASRAFYRVARAQVRVESTRDVAGWLDSVVSYNRARVNEGVAAEADLIRAELERDRAVSEISTQEAELVRARAELAAFVGPTSLDGQSRVAFATTVLPIPSVLTNVAQRADESGGQSAAAIGQALRARPDLLAAEARTKAAEAGIGVERTMLFRQLGATLGTKQMMGTTSMIAGVSLPLPFFDRNRGEIARATAEREAAAFDLDASTRAARAQLSGALAAARLLTERASALTASADTGFLARAEQARRIALGAYREGAVPLIQVLDAARAWSDARMTYFDLLFSQQESVLDVLYASGSDLRTVLPTSSSTPSR